jgi:DNA helicase HerA-like ATPase
MGVPKSSNRHTLIVGQTGSGKSTLVRKLLRVTARAIVMDRQHEYDGVKGAHISTTLADAVKYFTENRHTFFTLIFRPEEEEDYFRLIQLARFAQKEDDRLGPLVIFLEESSAYSNTHAIEGVIRDLYNKGRHERISLCSVIQLDTDVHRVTRSNSRSIVVLRMTYISSALKPLFGEEPLSLVSLSTEYTKNPVQGRHFLHYPPHEDFYTVWRNELGYVWQPITFTVQA